ncbi:MAG: hypothetical protein R2856_20090 [Caldilineaceae bacterium]
MGVHSIAGSLRRIGTNHPVNGEDGPSASAAPHGRLEIGDAIALIHRAGGRAFWAHPLLYEADLAQLGGCVAELKGKGLDGLEAIYASFSDEQRADLRRLAQEHDLLVSAGTDFHAVHGVGSPTYVIDMPRTTGFRCALRCSTAQPLPRTHLIWNSLRRRIAQRRRIRPPNRITSSAVRTGCASCCLRPSPRCSFGRDLGVILPSFEQSLLERKRELIRELTNSPGASLHRTNATSRTACSPAKRRSPSPLPRSRRCATAPKGWTISGSRTCSRV